MSTESRGSLAAGISIAFTTLAAVFVGARLIARVSILKNAGGDEIAIGLSLLSSITFAVFVCLQVKYGLGKHIETLSANDVEHVLKYLWGSILVYNASLSLTKTSIILQYLRVFVGRRFHIACWTMITIVLLYGLTGILSGALTCLPVSLFWDSTVKGTCVDKKLLWFFNASINIATDVIIFILPMPVISALKLPKKQRIGLMMIFAVGGFVCLVSILRLHSIYVASQSADLTWDNIDSSLWSSIECNVGIICASLPTLKPVISWLFPRLLSSSRSTGPVLPSHSNPSAYLSRGQFRNNHIPPCHIGNSPNTITNVEAAKHPNSESGGEREYKGHRSLGINTSKEIIVMSTMTQDVESKSEMGSEKDLIFQK